MKDIYDDFECPHCGADYKASDGPKNEMYIDIDCYACGDTFTVFRDDDGKVDMGADEN